jgi:FeS assembly SUF system protein
MNQKMVSLETKKLDRQRAGTAETAGTGTPAVGSASVSTMTTDPTLPLEQQVIAALRTVYDPEIPINIHELGLIYRLDVSPTGDVTIRMTLTSPACPVAGSLPGEVEAKVKAVPGVKSAKVELVWDPPYHPDMMSEAAKLQLGIY